MSTINQIFSLVKQELRQASRSRYIVISFILMPIFMWVLQGGVQMLIMGGIETTQEGETIYVINMDDGNDSLSAYLSTHPSFTTNNITNLGSYLVQDLINQTRTNGSLLLGAYIDYTTYENYTREQIQEMLADSSKVGDITPLVIIPKNFSDVYMEFGISSIDAGYVEIYSLPGGLLGADLLAAGISYTLSSAPYTIYSVQKYSYSSLEYITFAGEESAASGFGAGFIGFLSIIIAVMAPAAFVSTSFAGEREKKTMESLLSLPISRFNILLSKVIAGMALISVFALMNMVGLTIFGMMMNEVGNSGIGSAAGYAVDVTFNMYIIIGITMFLSAFVAIGLGISIASLTKDVRSAESMYSFFMLIPSMVVGLTGIFGSLPEQSFGEFGILLYIIPWSHSLAIFSKAMYPQTYTSSAITGNIQLDILFHLGYIVVSIAIIMFIASKIFDREGILT